MTQKQTGYVILLACVGMLLTAMSPEIKELQRWADALSPAFIGVVIGHVGAVIGAYIGGRITPTKE